ncbi:hypothetical protein Tco_0201652 [Tanacetum coccineum]
MPFARFTKFIVEYILSQHDQISKIPLSFHHVIKLDTTLGNLKFANKGTKDPIFGMAILAVMLNDVMKAYVDYSEYLAKSKGSSPVKDSSRGKGLLTKEGVEITIERVSISKRRHSKTMIEEVTQSEEGADVVDSEETEEDEEQLKLKGLETLSEAVQFKLNMKKARKASRHEFFKQQCPRGSGEGSGITPEVPDELTLKSSNKRAVKDVLSDEANATEKAVEAKKLETEPDTADVHMTEPLLEKPEAIKVCSYLTLSSTEFPSQFLNDNHEMTINDVLSDEANATEKAVEAKKLETEPDTAGVAQADVHMTEPLLEKPEAIKVCSYLTLSSTEFPITQGKPTKERPLLVDTTVTLILESTKVSPTQPPPTQPKRSKLKRILKKSKIPKSQVDVGELENRVTELKKKVYAMSSFNLPEEIDKSVKTHLKNVLLKDVLDFGKIKMEKAAKKSLPKSSATYFDQTALDIYNQNDNLYKMTTTCKEFNRHPTHKALYDALVVYLSVDEDYMDKKLEDLPIHKNRRMDDKDQDPPTDADKKGTTPSKPSKPYKSVQADDIVEVLNQEEAIDNEEPAVVEVVNTKEHPEDDDGLNHDWSKWSKQPPRPETLDPEWSKDPNADVGPEHNWFHDLEKTTKDQAEFDDLISSSVDFSNFIKHRLKKDKITKVDLEGLVFKLLKGTCRSSIELEYHFKQRYLGFSK